MPEGKICYTNVNQTPKFEKIVVNMGVGVAAKQTLRQLMAL